MTLGVGDIDGFEVAVHLERWFSFYVDSSIGIAWVRLCERSGTYFVARHAFCFGIAFVFGNALNVTLVRV